MPKKKWGSQIFSFLDMFPLIFLSMANTYTQIYIHIVFAVRGRDNMIKPEHREEIHKYITGIVQKREHKMIAINSMPDHVHILIGYDPRMALADLVRDI